MIIICIRHNFKTRRSRNASTDWRLVPSSSLQLPTQPEVSSEHIIVYGFPRVYGIWFSSSRWKVSSTRSDILGRHTRAVPFKIIISVIHNSQMKGWCIGFITARLPRTWYMIFFSASWWKVWSAWSDLERSTCTVTSLKITVWVCYNAYSGSELRVVSGSSLTSVKVTCVALTESAPYASLWLIMPLGTIFTPRFWTVLYV